MKSPQEWLSELSGIKRAKVVQVYVTESDIKAIQDEAFKAGMLKAASVVETWAAKTEIMDALYLVRPTQDSRDHEA